MLNITDILEFQETIEWILSVLFSVAHHAALALIANIDHHTDNLVSQVKETASFDYMLTFEFESSRIFVELQ